MLLLSEETGGLFKQVISVGRGLQNIESIFQDAIDRVYAMMVGSCERVGGFLGLVSV